MCEGIGHCSVLAVARRDDVTDGGERVREGRFPLSVFRIIGCPGPFGSCGNTKTDLT